MPLALDVSDSDVQAIGDDAVTEKQAEAWIREYRILETKTIPGFDSDDIKGLKGFMLNCRTIDCLTLYDLSRKSCQATAKNVDNIKDLH
jgi:hypothetical protein